MKKGFTLAEILVALGVVGVVSALTLPSLMDNSATAQLGPKLGTAVANFEQANSTMLMDYQSDYVTDMGLSISGYLKELVKYMKGASYLGEAKDSSGSSYYCIQTRDASNICVSATEGDVFTVDNPPGGERLPHMVFTVNGVSIETARTGYDAFTFTFWNDGSLRPFGGTDFYGGEIDGGKAERSGGKHHWTTQCAINKVPKITKYCAGHIFENNMKVLYK